MYKHLKNHITLILLLLCIFASICIGTKAKGAIADKIHWKTHSVGRYLIDLPMDAEVIYQNEYGGDKFIWRRDLTPETALKEAQAKIEKYKAIPHKEIAGASQFIESFPLPGGGIVVNRWNEAYSTTMSVMECYFISQDKRKRVFYTSSEIGDDKFDIGRKYYTELAPHIYAYDDWEPALTDAGFIFEGGIIKTGNQPWVREDLTIYFESKEWPGVQGEFSTYGVADAQKPMFERKGPLTSLGSMLSSTLKKSDCTIAGRKAQEYCVAATVDGRRMYDFLLEAPCPGKDMANPLILLNIYSIKGVYNTGNGFKSDKAALAVWNTIRNSVRMRPGAI